MVSRLVLLMLRVPAQAFLATTYIHLTLRRSYTVVLICSPNRFISCFTIIRSITIIYGLIIDPHNDQPPVGQITQVKWRTAKGNAEVTVQVHAQAFITTTSRSKCDNFIRSFQSAAPINAFHVLT